MKKEYHNFIINTSNLEPILFDITLFPTMISEDEEEQISRMLIKQRIEYKIHYPSDLIELNLFRFKILSSEYLTKDNRVIKFNLSIDKKEERIILKFEKQLTTEDEGHLHLEIESLVNEKERKSGYLNSIFLKKN